MNNIDIMIKRIGLMRKENGFSIDRVSNFCGLSEEEYIKLENGKIDNLTIEIIVKLSVVFDVSCDYLLGLTDTKEKSIFFPSENSQDRDMYRKIKLLTDEEKESLIEIIEQK